LIISRAGSGIIFEIAAVGKPSILIPFPEAAQDHQLMNAFLYAQTGAAVVIEKENFKIHFFLEKIEYLLNHQSELEIMAQKAKMFAKPDSAEIIAEYLISYLSKQ
jgi:UDP-N-acetylglucosamine--N-acetylmuramyl-(pentapeptide) pyrophosphoryl-undecaprenol N-acetylglucosamine transferase